MIFFIIFLILLFIPIRVTIYLDRDQVILSLYKIKVYSKKFGFSTLENVTEKINVKSLFKKENIKDVMHVFRLKELNANIGYISEDFEIMFFIQSFMYVVFPTIASYLDHQGILYSVSLVEEEIEKWTIESIVSFSLHKLIMQLMKNIYRRRNNKHGTSNT